MTCVIFSSAARGHNGIKFEGRLTFWTAAAREYFRGRRSIKAGSSLDGFVRISDSIKHVFPLTCVRDERNLQQDRRHEPAGGIILLIRISSIDSYPSLSIFQMLFFPPGHVKLKQTGLCDNLGSHQSHIIPSEQFVLWRPGIGECQDF